MTASHSLPGTYAALIAYAARVGRQAVRRLTVRGMHKVTARCWCGTCER